LFKYVLFAFITRSRLYYYFEVLQKARSVYGEVILAACHRILDYNMDMACKLLPLSVQMLIVLAKPNDEDPEDTSVAQTLMVELTQLFRTKLPVLLNGRQPGLDKCMKDLLRCMESVMEDSYRPTWSISLKCQSVLVQQLHTKVEEVQLTVESLVDLRNEVTPGSLSQHAVEDAMSTLIQGVGIEECWKWIRWQSSESASKNSKKEGIGAERAWILPTMKVAATAAQPTQPRLAFFQSEVLRLARDCDTLAATGNKDRNFHHTRVTELWSLFPCFCNSPSDVDAVMPSLITTIGRALEDKRYPQLVVSLVDVFERFLITWS
jgi:hypothetical protein